MPQVLFEDDPDFRIGYAWSEAMVRQGFYVHPWHNMFTCAAMTSADIEAAIKGADVAFAQVKAKRAKLQPNPKLQAFFAMLQ
jgi:glutamate-1-semialdehyde 2,1-aminomutase